MQEILSFLEGKHALKVSSHLQDRKDSSQSSIKPVHFFTTYIDVKVSPKKRFSIVILVTSRSLK